MASFVGKKYKLDKSENFDEYMKELGKCLSRIKKHELESSKKCYVNWQMPCKEVAKRREQRVWEKKPKTRHRKTTASRPAFFFFFAQRCKKKRKDEIHMREKWKTWLLQIFGTSFLRHCSTFTTGPINISIQIHTHIYKLRNNWW